MEDLHWWAGWTRTTARDAVAGLSLDEPDLHGRPGIALAGVGSDVPTPAQDEPVAALLPALDPTPMGWKRRDWFLGIDPALVFDRAGNIGPTIWWDGEIVGSWAAMARGDLRTAMVVDRGREARDAVERMAEHLHQRLNRTAVTPAVRTPLERSLTEDSATG